MSEYRKCPNGHYYTGEVCPYCKTEGIDSTITDMDHTIVMPQQLQKGGLLISHWHDRERKCTDKSEHNKRPSLFELILAFPSKYSSDEIGFYSQDELFSEYILTVLKGIRSEFNEEKVHPSNFKKHFTVSPYLSFKIISVAILLVVMVVVLISKKSEKKTEKEVVNDDNEEKQPVVSEYELRRISLYRLEYKLIPIYVDILKRNPDIEVKLIDTSYWEKEIVAMAQPQYIDWDEISCEIIGDVNSEFVILYEFPKPFDTLLAKYGAVYINKQKQIYDYYTLERSLNGYMLCSTSKERHLNFGNRDDLSKEEFIKEVCDLLGVDRASIQGWRLAKRKFSVSDFKDLVEVTDNSCEKFISDNSSAVVCFYDLFSAHSKLMLPVLSDLATEYKGKVKVGIYDVYELGNETVRAANNILAMPTFIFLKNGKEVDRHIGICSVGDMKAWFEELLDFVL